MDMMNLLITNVKRFRITAASVNKKTDSKTKVFIYHYRILKEEDKQ